MLDTLPTVEFAKKWKISEGSKKNEQLLIKDGRHGEVQIMNDEVEEEVMKRSITNQVSSLMHIISNLALEFRKFFVSTTYQIIF